MKIEVTHEEFKNYKLSLEDILVNRVNSIKLIEKSALIMDRDLQDRIVFEAINIRVSYYFKLTSLPNYVNLLLQNINTRSYFMREAKKRQAKKASRFSRFGGKKFCAETFCPPCFAKSRDFLAGDCLN